MKSWSTNVHQIILAIHIIILSQYFTDSINIPTPDYFYYDFVGLYYNDHKIIELARYVTGILFIGLYYMAIILISSNASQKSKVEYIDALSTVLNKENKQGLTFYTLGFIALPYFVYILISDDLIRALFQGSILLVGIFFPAWQLPAFHSLRTASLKLLGSNGHGDKTNTKQENTTATRLYLPLTLLALAQLVYIFHDSIHGKPKIINEYWDVPEATIINHTPLDNTEFWRQHFPSSITQMGDLDNIHVTINCTQASPTELNLPHPDLLDTFFYYNTRNNIFCINGSPDDAKNPLNAHQKIQPILQHLVDNDNKLKRIRLSTEAQEFINHNSIELQWKVLSRYMFHHNMFILNPINEFALERDKHEIISQYGLAFPWMAEKILTLSNNLSFDGWLKLSYIFYIAYYILLLLIIFAITGSTAWTALLYLSCIAVLNSRGYDFLIMPPGESPWRHFADIFIVFGLYLYGRSGNALYYYITLLLAILSILLNPQIGAMIYIATTVSLIFYSYREKQSLLHNSIAAIIASGIAIYAYIATNSQNALAKYYLDGAIGFPVSDMELVAILVILVAPYFILLRIISKGMTKNYLHLLFLLLYAQALLLYVVWHFNSDGFKSRAHIYILTIGLLLYSYRSTSADKLKSHTLAPITLAVTVIYIISASTVLEQKREYQAIFSNHVTYDWEFDKARIQTTMPPDHFKESIDLIQKHVQSEKGIYIISDYDAILPYLAGRYSLMPFFDLKWYLITPKEVSYTKILLEERKPEYIFVDTNHSRNFNNDIIDSSYPDIGYLHEESVWRVQRLKLLYSIFTAISPAYELIETGKMISVYRRKGVE